MRIVTPVDRLIQAGGERVTMIFWLLAVAGAVTFALTDLPTAVSLGMAGVGVTAYWLRWRNISLAGLLRRIAFTRARDGDVTD